MTHFYRLTIQYKGTNYHGWQIQPTDKTVQGELNLALEAISKGKVQSLGAGRTDAGVHALGQVAKIGIELEISPASLQKALNSNLPDDIRIIDCATSTDDFHPTVQAKSKEYHYRFTVGREATAFQNELIANYPFEVDLAVMREACKILVGKHDFTNYYCEGTEVLSNVRTIYECEVLEVKHTDWEMLPPHYVFRVVGDGFLKQMVRCLVGVVWSIGRGKISLEEFRSSLSDVRVKRPGIVAPPNGLYMVRVNY